LTPGAKCAINSLSADVAANGHAIDTVRFFSGPEFLGQADAPPYRLSWTNVPSGNYTLLAEATYEGGDVMSSPPVQVTVPALPGPASIPFPAHGAAKGAIVTLHNIPYTIFRVYGLFATDQNDGGACGIELP